MNSLENLIDQKVIAKIAGIYRDHQVEGTVVSVDIDDFYFSEKGKPIYITVAISPTSELPKGINSKELLRVPIEHIRKASKTAVLI